MAKAKGSVVRWIGKCIYCGASNALTNEHILAANLGGDRVLGAASCYKCQIIINEDIEQPCLQKTFPHIRYRRGIGRRRVNRRPNTLSAWSRNLDGSELAGTPNTHPLKWTKTSLPYGEHPSFLSLPVFNTAGILAGLSPEQAATLPMLANWNYIEPSTLQDRAIFVEIIVDMPRFMRLLAKTAHCFAVAHLGLEGFRPMLKAFILGEDSTLGHYVIGTTGHSKVATQSPFSLNVGAALAPGQPTLNWVSIQLFADLGAPTYEVVVGTGID